MLKKELFGLVETMNAMGLSDDSILKRTTISEINYFHDDIITEHGLQMLEKKFNIKCAESFHSGIFKFFYLMASIKSIIIVNS